MRLSPISRQELVRRLKRAGFDGPFDGGKHQFLRQAPVPTQGQLARCDTQSSPSGHRRAVVVAHPQAGRRVRRGLTDSVKPLDTALGDAVAT